MDVLCVHRVFLSSLIFFFFYFIIMVIFLKFLVSLFSGWTIFLSSAFVLLLLLLFISVDVFASGLHQRITIQHHRRLLWAPKYTRLARFLLMYTAICGDRGCSCTLLIVISLLLFNFYFHKYIYTKCGNFKSGKCGMTFCCIAYSLWSGADKRK